MVLPSDFGLPPTQYLIGLLGAAAIVGVLLYRVRPPVTEGTVTALAPWMAAGGGLYALYQVGGVPDAAAPLFGSPAVYVTVGVLAGAVWLGVADRSGDEWTPDSAPGVLAVVGTTLLAVVFLAAYAAAESPDLGVSGLILVASALAAGAVWAGLRRVRDVAAIGTVGVLTVFGHALDGVSTAVGYDHLGFGEQTPLSRIVLHAGEALPTAEFVGSGWLFVVVKLALAAVVVALFESYVREEPGEGYLLLGLVVAVGLGPGAHNVVLFAIS
ncbi:DUF63 family protein [Natronomonas salina]|uniref:DUF63 family protein n=1 Tax=Natronomonas salina TaxID=1710540 RepID=UPI001BAB0E61|nr:DUF63 family protein [Natronomonas salina]